MSDDSEVQNAAAILSPNIKAQTPPWMANTSKAMLPQGMPNQLQMLSANLAAGGFGTQPHNMTWLDQVYDPVEVTKFNTPPPKPTSKPKTPTTVTKKPDPAADRATLRQRGYEQFANPDGPGMIRQRTGGRNFR